MSNKSLLKSLSAAALALPAIAANAGSAADAVEIGVRYNNYQEKDMAVEDIAGGSVERYEVEVNQFNLLLPLNDKFQVNLSLQQESMSGASPWFTQKVDGEVKQVMSGATIQEERTDVIGTLTYFGDNFSLSGTVANSSENDYNSMSFGTDLSYEFADNMTTLALSADASFDEITPTDALTYDRTPYEEKESWSVHASLSRILTKNLVVQLGIGLFNRSGYLSDPYKLVVVEGADDFDGKDTRPDSRLASTYSARVRYFVEGINTALHLDYRIYDDNWNVFSHTIDFSPYINLGSGWQIVPSIRFYSQSNAFFYEDYYEAPREDGYYSVDSRLSTFGAYTYGLKINKQFEHWFLTAGYQHYTSSHDYALDDYVDSSTSLVEFDMISAGLNYKF